MPKTVSKKPQAKKDKKVPVDFVYYPSRLGEAILTFDYSIEDEKRLEEFDLAFLEQNFWVPVYVAGYDKKGNDIIMPKIYFNKEKELYTLFEQASRFYLFRYKKELRDETGIFLMPMSGYDFLTSFPLKIYKGRDIIIDYGREDKMRFNFDYNLSRFLINAVRKHSGLLGKK